MVRSRASGGRHSDRLLRWLAAAFLVALLLIPRSRQWLIEQTASVTSSPTDRADREIPQTAEVSDPSTASGKSPIPDGPVHVETHAPAERDAPDPKSRESTADRAPPGKLTEIRRNVLQSAAGLLYTSGSSDGHRLKHVMQHAEDVPEKKIHGVFDGDQDRILAVIDEAFLRSRGDGSDVRRETQRQRTVLTVRFHRRIGYVGGEEGQRQGHPECRFLRLVLENGSVVVTAYPTRSF